GGEAEITSTGNDSVVVVLRGGSGTGPNYSHEFVQQTKLLQRKNGVVEAVGIDASHANSNKDYTKQIDVVNNVSDQLAILGEQAIKFVMVESYLVEGKQDHEKAKIAGRELIYGQSITDGCVNLEQSEEILDRLAHGVRERRTRTLYLP